MALKDQWQAQKQQRQTEILNRSAQVHAHLTTLTTKRQVATEQLQANLRQFRTNLVAAEMARKEAGQQQQGNLHAYALRLHQEIQEFLANCATERSLISDEVATTLQDTIAQWQAETRQFLAQARQRRQERYRVWRQDLIAYIEMLQEEMSAYAQRLQQMRLERQRAVESLKDEVKKNLAQRRQERSQQAQILLQALQDYRLSLHQLVWGNDPPSPTVTPVRTISPEKTLKPTPAPKEVSLATPAPSKPEAPSAKVSPRISPLLPKPDQKNGKLLSTEEEQVYNYLCSFPGSRLTTIEEALGINRVQAVDTLRLLMKKGMVTQRDRLYSVI